MIPIGPVSDIVNKKHALLDHGGQSILDMKKFGDPPMIDHAPVVENINVDLKDLNNPKRFEKLFSSRVIDPPPNYEEFDHMANNADTRSRHGAENTDIPDTSSRHAPDNTAIPDSSSRRIAENNVNNDNESKYPSVSISDDIARLTDNDGVVFDQFKVDDERKKSRHMAFVKASSPSSSAVSAPSAPESPIVVKQIPSMGETATASSQQLPGWHIVTMKGSIGNSAQIDKFKTRQNDNNNDAVLSLMSHDRSMFNNNFVKKNQSNPDVDIYINNLNKLLDDMERRKNSTVSVNKRDREALMIRQYKTNVVNTLKQLNINDGNHHLPSNKTGAALSDTTYDVIAATSDSAAATLKAKHTYDPCGGEPACLDSQLPTL